MIYIWTQIVLLHQLNRNSFRDVFTFTSIYSVEAPYNSAAVVLTEYRLTIGRTQAIVSDDLGMVNYAAYASPKGEMNIRDIKVGAHRPSRSVILILLPLSALVASWNIYLICSFDRSLEAILCDLSKIKR